MPVLLPMALLSILLSSLLEDVSLHQASLNSLHLLQGPAILFKSFLRLPIGHYVSLGLGRQEYYTLCPRQPAKTVPVGSLRSAALGQALLS